MATGMMTAYANTNHSMLCRSRGLARNGGTILSSMLVSARDADAGCLHPRRGDSSFRTTQGRAHGATMVLHEECRHGPCGAISPGEIESPRWSPGLAGAHECAGELAVNLGGNSLRVESHGYQELAGIGGGVDASRLDGRVVKAHFMKQVEELLLLERPGHASDPQFHGTAHFGRHLAAHDHVRHRKPAAGPQHTERLAP